MTVLVYSMDANSIQFSLVQNDSIQDVFESMEWNRYNEHVMRCHACSQHHTVIFFLDDM